MEDIEKKEENLERGINTIVIFILCIVCGFILIQIGVAAQNEFIMISGFIVPFIAIIPIVIAIYQLKNQKKYDRTTYVRAKIVKIISIVIAIIVAFVFIIAGLITIANI